MRAATTTERAVRRELTVAAQEGQLGRVRDFIVNVCEEAGFSAREVSNTKLAVDEACTNIIKHAYSGRPGGGDITVVAEIESGRIKVHLKDRGKHFDFSSVKDPDLDQYVETGKKGGLGVFLINRLMDSVEYRANDGGNELILTKRSQATFSSSIMSQRVPVRGTLRFKFMVRAGSGFALLMVVLWSFVFMRQTHDIQTQRTTRWLEKRRVAENISSRSVSVLLNPDDFSIDQTNLSAELAKQVAANPDVAYVRLVDATSNIRASGKIDEVFQHYQPQAGKVLLDEGRVVWTLGKIGERDVRDISVAVIVQGADNTSLEIGKVHLGVYEDGVEASVEDTRLQTSLLLAAIFLVGILLIIGLVQVFVKPIQMLTDGVRAIGDGNLDGKLDVSGPAEIGAIAGVFNEITEKFKKARDSVLEQEKMQKEIEVAKQIQQSLLPRKRPEISGYDIAPLYQAAAEVGGDYYDFVQVDDDTIGVVVADVSGKGVPGSLVMTMIRTALRMEARGNRNASDVMSKMNSFVTDDMKKGMFVTMFYVILDSKNRIISYASAGHNPMILYRHETKETFFLNPRGFPVGISLPDETLFRRSISLEKVRLKKDDMLVIYTDGVTEAMNERREQYGEERLIQMVKEYAFLPPTEFIEKLDGDIKKFTGEYPQSDDITVVAVKEKLTADDVLYGIRKKLLELVDGQGLSVKDACQQMRVSPATYYRYKKRLETMGERGLRNDVLRDDVSLKRVSLEARKAIIHIIAANPDLGAKRITEEYNKDRDAAHQISERMVYDELKRLNMNTRELRIDYLKRNRLLKDDFATAEGIPGANPPSATPAGTPAAAGAGTDGPSSTPRDLVEDLLRDIPGVAPAGRGAGSAGVPGEPAAPRVDDALFDIPSTSREGGVGVAVSSSDGITDVRVSGHLDSGSSGTLEKKLQDLITGGSTRIVVDLTDISYVSSGGWGIFVSEVKNLRNRGGDIVLSGMTSEVYDVYELLGFADVLRAFKTIADARAFLALPPDERRAGGEEIKAAWTPKDAGLRIETAEGDFNREWQSLQVEATTVGEHGEIAVLSLKGIIDTVSAEKLRETLDRVIKGGRVRVVTDMSQVEYVSSGGWGVFTERLRELRRAGGDIKLFGMDPDVYYVFTMLGFNIVLSSFDLLVDAIEDFRAPRTDADLARSAAEPARAEAPRFDQPAQRIIAQTPGMDIVWESSPEGVRIARISGVIETTAVSLLSDELNRELALAPRALLFDLTGVEYISSSGWGQFARTYEVTRAVALFGMNPDLDEVYSFLEFRSFLKAYTGEQEAIQAVLAPGTGVPEAPRAQRPAPVTPEIVHDDHVDDVLGKSLPGSGTRPASDDKPRIDAAPMDTTTRRAPAVPQPEEAPKSADLDVASATQDRNVNQDDKLRTLGWQKYGERLKKRADSGKLKDSGGGDIDPDEKK
ncbi:MAG TPA: anti-sigma factor antagonist [Candidatus Krumholzibacteria bacterium]|nr:anti-sigma factor antagonist [Candidatus Krumholzibacteria bacterium]